MRAPLLALVLALVAAPIALAAHGNGPRRASDDAPGGAFTCDFAVTSEASPLTLAGTIERDRMYMAARPGMLHKRIPVVPDPTTGDLLSGGRYLFDTAAHASEYLDWVRNDFVLDGVHFLERSYFTDVDCHAWRVLAVDESGDFRDQTALRTERWRVQGGADPTLLRAWPQLAAEGRARGYTALWAMVDDEQRVAEIVYFAPRSVAPPSGGDALAFAALKDAPPLGARLDHARGWERTMDRTQFTLSVWLPFLPGDRGEAALWPNSPPFPQPSPGDGVCEPSRGEDASSSLGDCGPDCGNARPDEGETTTNCPSDVRPWG